MVISFLKRMYIYKTRSQYKCIIMYEYIEIAKGDQFNSLFNEWKLTVLVIFWSWKGCRRSIIYIEWNNINEMYTYVRVKIRLIPQTKKGIKKIVSYVFAFYALFYLLFVYFYCYFFNFIFFFFPRFFMLFKCLLSR